MSNNALQTNCDFPGHNLIATYNTFYLQQESPAFNATLLPDAIGHLRKVLVQATDTPNQVGYGVGLVQPARILFEHAGYARDSAQSQNLVEMKQHIEHALNTLYGKADPRYGDIDQNGIPSDPSDGYGLLVYTRKMSETIQVTVNHAAATANMKSHGTQVRTALSNLGNGAERGWLALFHERANLALAATTANNALVYTNQMVGIAGRILNGEDLNDNGQIKPVTGEGSAQTAYLYSQYVVDYDPQALVTPPTSTSTADRALTLYIMDHGAYDKIYLDEPRSERLLPQDLHAWLNQLESAVPGVKVNIVIEACNSGSFIDPEQTISKAGRVVITSAGAFSLAWASPTGAAFSDAFLDALATGQNLYLAFDEACTNAQRRHNDQVAWLDDDGDGVPNDGQDGTLAAARGFNNPNSFDSSKDGQWKPYVVAAEVRNVAAHQHAGAAATRVRGEIWAEVRDNSSVKTVLATIYPPSYQPPTTSEALVIGPPPITLQARGNDMYTGLYGAFEEMGTYRIVISAIDDDNLESRMLEFNFSTGSRILLPIISR